ncbi:MAG: hypothetical protein LBE38_00995 [Deltaproteobacteria bacterium]|jgi:hypothetical protein|nr:hypothetical protein [Deltaproteobacteria bacterium]
MPRKLIYRVSYDESKFVLVEGRDVLSRYQQIKEELKSQPELAAFLAEPVKNKQEGYINWYSQLDDLWPLSSMTQEAGQNAQKLLTEQLKFWEQLRNKFSSSDRFNIREVSFFMDAALKNTKVLRYFQAPSGTLVVVAWGLTAAESLPIELDSPEAPEPIVDIPPSVPAYSPPPEPVYIAPPLPVNIAPPEPKKPTFNYLKLFKGLILGGLIGFFLTLLVVLLIKPEFVMALPFFREGTLSDNFERGERRAANLRDELWLLQLDYLNGRGGCLIIPETRSFGFVGGCYSTRDGAFFNALTGQSATLVFCHDEARGLSEFRIMTDGELSCRASAQASWDGANASFKSSGPIVCSQGEFPPMVILCEPGKPAGTEASCSLTEQNQQEGEFIPIPLELRKNYGDKEAPAG